jgi:hypothetical protein
MLIFQVTQITSNFLRLLYMPLPDVLVCDKNGLVSIMATNDLSMMSSQCFSLVGCTTMYCL